MSPEDATIGEAKVLHLFPTFVWQCDLDRERHQRINRRIVPKIDELLPHRDDERDRSSWNTHPDLHLLDEFSELVEVFRLAVEGVLYYLKIDPRGGTTITGCWANVNAPGSSHPQHVHPNNFLSGVYYVRAPVEADGLICYDPRPQRLVMSPRAHTVTPENSSDVTLPIKEGRMFVFPSWLLHSVGATRGDSERISVSFNVMFSAFAENFAAPKWKQN
jgi:uncharacterized protein (TIGR02466 family)